MSKLMQGLAAAALGAAMLAGCAETPPAPTVAALTITADPGLNPSPDGQPSPAVVRLYRLAGAAQFELADFFQLTDDAQGVLQADLIGVQDLVMTPGATQSLQVELEPAASALGVTVAYRALDQATWRAVVEVPPNQTTPVFIELQPLAVQMRAEPPA